MTTTTDTTDLEDTIYLLEDYADGDKCPYSAYHLVVLYRDGMLSPVTYDDVTEILGDVNLRVLIDFME